MNLLEGTLKEIDRVQEIVKEYESLPNGAGNFAAHFMRIDIKQAKESITENDVVKMLVAYKKLKEYEL